MMKSKQQKYLPVFLFGLFLSVSFSLQAEQFTKDEDYFEVFVERPIADPARVEVSEFFWYACPHCYTLEPHINGWMKNKPENVDFELVPAMFERPNVIMHAKSFYALNLMGVEKELHEKIFHAIHTEKERLNTEEEMEAFLKKNEVNLEEYRKAMKSFSVNVQSNKARDLAKDYEISGVPTLVVGGKYRAASMEGPRAIELLNFLVDKVAKEQAAASEG